MTGTITPNPNHQTPIPPSVRKAAERADELLRMAAGGEPQPEGQEDPQNEGQEGQEPQNEGQEPEAQDPPQRASQGDDDPNSETWEQRYRSEQGRTRKLQNEMAHLSAQVDNLRQTMATLQAPPAATPAELTFEDITPEEREAYGDDLISVVDKRARLLANEMVADIRREMEELRGTVTVTTQDAAERRREATKAELTRLEPDWMELNVDPRFLEFLAEAENKYGPTRKELLNIAFQNGDAAECAAIFQKFTGKGARAPQGNQPTLRAPKPTLEKFAAPGKASPASAAQSSAADEDEIITRADIARFYADRAANKFRGREKEADAYEAKIFAATNAGRVR